MTRENANAALWFVDRHVEKGLGDKTAFIEGNGQERQITYADLAQQTDRMADLYARHGLSREDRAAMIVLDEIEFPTIFWGSMKAGVVPIAINTLLSTELYRLILEDSRACALFISAALYPVVAPAIEDNTHLRAVFVIGGDGEGGHLDFGAELDRSSPVPAIEVTADECAFWLYSSGSTGQPKGVRHVHGSLRATVDTYSDNILAMRADDVVFSAAKLFFAYGLGNGMTFPMSVGATTWLYSARPTPDAAFEMIGKAKPTIFFGVPTLYAAMVAGLSGEKAAGEKLAGGENLRQCVSAGEALPAEIGRKWRELTSVDILDGVGSTEMLHIFLSNKPGDVVYGTSGVAVPGYDLRLVDDQGKEVGNGEVGELLVCGASAAEGYWNQRDKSRATFEGCWTRTGDKYERRDDGRYIYCGRTDDMFKVSGIWVAPFEVEQALITHDSVLEAAVVAAKDDDGLDKPKAYVVLKGDADARGLDEPLKDHVKDEIGKWKYPRWIEFVDDLPKTATGKIQRFKLRG